MWTMRSWVSTDLGTTHEPPVRLTDKEAMHRIGVIAKTFGKYPHGRTLLYEDNGDIFLGITNEDNGYSLTYLFREE